jgi:hypothetical protein
MLLLVILIFDLSCKDRQQNLSQLQSLNFLIGNWIPEKIDWKNIQSGVKEIDSVARQASFKTLCFDRDSAFYILVSTQSSPRDYDSIIFEGEPGVVLYKGNWMVKDSIVKVYYKLQYPFSNSPDTSTREATIKFKYGADTLLLFENSLYKRGYLYDKISEKKIEAYKNENTQ